MRYWLRRGILSDKILEIDLFSFIGSHITFESELNVGTEDDINYGSFIQRSRVCKLMFTACRILYQYWGVDVKRDNIYVQKDHAKEIATTTCCSRSPIYNDNLVFSKYRCAPIVSRDILFFAPKNYFYLTSSNQELPRAPLTSC